MSKRAEIRERKRKQKEQRKLMTIGIIILGAGLIAAALIFPSLGGNEMRERYMANNNAMGDPNAPIKIVEYSSYKCGHCAAFSFETEPLLEEAYIKTGKVYFVSIAVWDELSAQASYCAGEQNKYWQMHDIIFANQAMPFDENIMKKWAKSAGADVDKYNQCMEADTYAERVTQDNADAEAAGVTGTPSFVVSYLADGEIIQQMLPGNYPFEAFQQVIEEGLVAMGLE